MRGLRKEAKFKWLRPVWIDLYDILEQENLSDQRTDLWLPGVQGGTDYMGEERAFGGGGEALFLDCSGGCTVVRICQN